MNTWITLLKRELWEHKVSALYLPLAIATILIVALIFASFGVIKLNDNLHIGFDLSFNDVSNTQENMHNAGDAAANIPLTLLDDGIRKPSDWDFYELWKQDIEQNSSEDGQRLIPSEKPKTAMIIEYRKDDDGNIITSIQRSEKGNVVLNFICFIFMSVWIFSMFFYLLDCMYQERKDRSILFWQSMPISEWKNIVIKLIFAGYIMGLIYWGLSVVVQVFTAIYLQSDVFLVQGLSLQFDSINLILHQISGIILAPILALPLMAWLMLISVSVNRAPMLLAIVIPAILMALEKWLFWSDHLATWIKFYYPYNLSHSIAGSGASSFISFLANGKLWIGLIAAFLLLFVVGKIRLRQSH